MNSALTPLSLPLLNYYEGLPERLCQTGEVLLKEGSKSNRLYILIDGAVEVRKEGVMLKATAETGAIFGEISVLLDTPHIATVTTSKPSRLYEVMDGAGFIDSHPELGMPLAKLLAKRLTAMSVHFSSAKLVVDRLIEQQPELSHKVGEQTHDLEFQIVERTRAEKNLQQQFMRISLLSQITRAMAERQEFNSILQIVLRELESNLSIDFGAVLLINDETESVTIAATRLKSHGLNSPLELQDGDTLTMAQTGLAGPLQGRTFYAKDTARQPERLFRLLSATGFECAVAVPLTVAEKPFGVLLAARRTVDGFGSGECEFLRMLSDHVALAAHQARLYQQLQTAYDELKQTQQAIMQQERLRALGEMASGIAHDINNTLSPIVVYSELITRTEPNLSETSRRHLNSIRTAGEDIAHFVTRLRDFYRKRERTSDDVTDLDCNDLVEQVIDLTRPRWRDIPLEKGMVVRLCPELQPALPGIDANASELREALTNLILNAVDAMPTGGTLTLRTRLETPAASGALSQVIIEVIDTGNGMDEETRTRCLEPFFSTKGQRGTGLGLAMVYGIMERHDGKIEIDSAIGKGTTIRLIFPVRQRSATIPETSVRPQPTAPLRILYIDDEPLLRELLKETLELDGHSVTVAEDGRAGVEAFRAAAGAQQPFNVVITDLGMPHMDGRQVARTLKKEYPQIPIILLTGWGAMMQSDKDPVGEVDAIVSKPPRVHELRETLDRLAQA